MQDLAELSTCAAIFTEAYPNCWGKNAKGCDHGLLNSLTYSQIAGIIVGMLTLGYLTDRIGRKWGSVVTAGTMLVGKSFSL